jgi:4-alpha-glucanotransferase
VDRVDGFERIAEDLDPAAELRAKEFVDYAAVTALKLKALGVLYRIFQAREDDTEMAEFERFTVEGGEPLYLHALFEVVSLAMTQQGHGSGWHGWPEDYRHPGSDKVRALAEEQADLVTFHVWLQWIADRQLAEAQARACRAGMRIGLYLDLAVGVAPDGSATWTDRKLTIPDARIGAPPDYFNANGQDWGIAPLSPTTLAQRQFEPFRMALDAVVRHAGALRIDHAMSLYRLFWIASGFTAADGVYVRYPFTDMLRTLCDVSQARRTIVIGEDLGIVPPGFREVMRQLEIQSYRVFFFEKRDDHFIPPEEYPREALACITTHDLHTLAGWWAMHDLEVREKIGLIAPDDLDRQKEDTAHERRRVLGLLNDRGLLPPEMEPVMRGEAPAPAQLPLDVAVALHKLVARSPARLFAVAAEDLVATVEQVNIPGTTDEHANWRRKLPVTLEELPDVPFFRAICRAVAEERPRAS